MRISGPSTPFGNLLFQWGTVAAVERANVLPGIRLIDLPKGVVADTDTAYPDPTERDQFERATIARIKEECPGMFSVSSVPRTSTHVPSIYSPPAGYGYGDDD